jgi:hypothetical protein
MEKFSAVIFFTIGRYLAGVKGNTADLINKDGNSRATELGVDADHQSNANVILTQIKNNCESIGLTVSTKAVSQLLKMRGKEGTTLGNLMDAITHLEQTITWEMEDKLFMYVPPDRASRYNEKELFGKEVNAKFPTIQFDLTEAGNCYALGRGTAAVFHLMRTMEVGVQEFGKKLGVTLTDEKNWQNILDEIDKAIRALPKTPERTKMSQASANLYAVKLAWRNEVMHPKDTYTLEEADNLIRQVKIFMEQLASII